MSQNIKTKQTKTHKSAQANTEPTKLSAIAGHVGAWILTGTAMLATTEMMLHNLEHAAIPPQVGSGHTTQAPSVEPTVARAEGAKESARLPEEYDIGLRTPAIAST